RNFTLNESPPLVQMPIVQLNSPGCGGHVTFSATKSGSPVSKRYLPWMVLLVTRTLSGVYRYCSGTIITERHVLTAGHCTFYTKHHCAHTVDDAQNRSQTWQHKSTKYGNSKNLLTTCKAAWLRTYVRLGNHGCPGDLHVFQGSSPSLMEQGC
ncbi:hypothetical protein MTO96_032124, partial [Rhipicephalus appendiculatus]